MYIVEGNIGVGKSTFLSLIAKHLPSLNYVLEPVDTWATQKFGRSLLEQFYSAPERWAYTLETLAMMCRSRDHLALQEGPRHQLIERSIYSGHYCFALNGKKEGYFSPVEWDAYLEWVHFILNDRCKAPTGFIYLQADPDVCYARIIKRKRAGESLISKTYLSHIHDRHNEFLIEKKNLIESIQSVPVLVLDANIDFVDNPNRMKQLAEQISAFIQATSSSPLRCQMEQKTNTSIYVQ